MLRGLLNKIRTASRPAPWDDAAVAEACTYVPLFLGAFLVDGLFLKSFLLLAVIVGAIAALRTGLEVKKPATRILLFFISAACICYVIGSRIHLATISLLVLAMLLPISASAEQTLPKTLIRIFGMCALAILGVLAQSEMFLLDAGALGLVPGGLLGGAELISRAKTLEGEGYSRYRVGTSTTGEKGASRRPGALAQILAVYVIGFPALLVCLAALGIFPPAFIFMAFFLYNGCQITSDFLNEVRSDDVLAVRTAGLAGLSLLVEIAILLIVRA
jgi:hypothetical protein